MRRRRGRLGIGFGAVVLAVLVALAAPGPASRALFAAAVDLTTGYRVAFEGMSFGGGRAVFRELRIAREGSPFFAARSLQLRYRLRDLLPGGAHRYGLVALALAGPHLTLERRRDGRFAVLAPGAGGGVGTPSAGSAAPLAFDVAVADGSIELLDPYRTLPRARRLTLEALGGRIAVDSAGRSWYRLRARMSGDPAQVLALNGRVDAQGFALHRLRAHDVDVLPWLDYLIDSQSARVLQGRLRDLEVTAYAFGPSAYHVVGSGTLADGAMRVPGLLPSATRMRGRIDLFDDGVAAARLAARLGPLDVALAGGIYDWHAPAFRLGIAAQPGRLSDVRRLFAFSRRLPLRGSVRLASLLEGPVGNPLVATKLVAPAFAYGAFPFTRASGRAIYFQNAVDIADARAEYGGLDARLGGAVDIGPGAATRLVARVGGGAERVPYLAQAAPGTIFDADALLVGRGLRLAALGAAAAAGNATRLAGVFALDEFGDGTFGPLSAERADGSSFAGTFYSHRSAGESGFWLDARHFAFTRPLVAPHLPGLALAPPPFVATLDGSVAGQGPPSAFRLAGRVRARDVRVGTLSIDAADGALAGAFGNVTLGGVRASGRWGTFWGRGGYSGGRLALSGDYAGTFARLAELTGDLGATGPVDGPVALLIDSRRTIVQARAARTQGAHVRGVALDRLDGTLAVGEGDVRLYAGTAELGGGSLAAAGTLASGGGVGVSLAGVAAGGAGKLVALSGGQVSAIGRLERATGGTRAGGGLAVAGARLDGLPLAANGDFTLSGTHLRFDATDAGLGAAVGRLAGSVDGLGTAGARFDVALHLTAARLAPFARAVAPERSDVAGTLMGDFRIAGTPGAPGIAGMLRIPEGSLNGLAYRDASARIRFDQGGIVARAGTLAVGSTHATFEAAFRGRDAALRLAAPQADLSDFNAYFDAGDMLGGRGRIAARFTKRGSAVYTAADATIAALHYRRFALGDASARWYSQGSNVEVAAAFGGASGRLQVAGRFVPATSAPLGELVGRSRFEGNARLRGLDLGVWLPALGYQVPLVGRVDADAVVSGPLGNPDVKTEATLAQGSFGSFPIERLTLAATSTRNRTTITRAELNGPSLAATLSGSFGLRDRDPLALGLHLKSSDVGALAARAGRGMALGGAAEMDVKIGGTRAVPRVAGGFDFEHANVRGVGIPRALGEFSLRGREVVLSDVEVGFSTGTLYFAGSVPLEIQPLGLGPAQAPITLELSAKGLDLSDLAPLLPSGSTLRGRVDGHVQVSGTAGAPRLGGTLALSDGAFRSPLETVPLTQLRAALAFEGNSARLTGFHAEAGGGNLDGDGFATFASLIHPGADAAYRLAARAKRLHLDVPAFGNGLIDGALVLAHTPGTVARLAGSVALSEASIPFSALLVSGAGGAFEAPNGSSPVAPSGADVAFDLALAAQRNVRVRSANVDIGVRGSLHVAGTRSAPRLAGGFESTGGTLAYFNTVFRLTTGSVAFLPERGLVPTLDAQATTHVINPDPNAVRNVSGSADITLDVSGPLDALSIGLSSEPAYDRQQILGLLLNAPALGATNLFGERSGPTLYGSNSAAALPPGVIASRGTNGQLSVAQEAFGIANAQFTRTLLAPIETSFASAVGLSSFNVNVDYTGSVGLTARKVLGKKLGALYGTSFGYPYRQTFGFELKPSDATAAQVTVFQTLGAAGLDSLAPAALALPNQRLQAAQPATGTTGFSLSLQRLYP